MQGWYLVSSDSTAVGHYSLLASVSRLILIRRTCLILRTSDHLLLISHPFSWHQSATEKRLGALILICEKRLMQWCYFLTDIDKLSRQSERGEQVLFGD